MSRIRDFVCKSLIPDYLAGKSFAINKIYDVFFINH
jgi:hypothetical protein